MLNSVDSIRAERDVLLTLNALCRPGGLVFFSGRRSEFNADALRAKVSARRKSHGRRVQFTDRHGFSGNFRHGEWFFQKFHNRRQALALGGRFIGPGIYDLSKSSWRIRAINERRHPAGATEAALSREFDLPLPGNRRFGRSQDILNAWRESAAMEQWPELIKAA